MPLLVYRANLHPPLKLGAYRPPPRRLRHCMSVWTWRCGRSVLGVICTVAVIGQ